MSTQLPDNLSRDKIGQLLSAVGSKPAQDTVEVQVTDLDWHRPRCFTDNQLETLNSLAKQIADAIADKFIYFFQSNFDVTISSTRLYFAGELTNELLAGAKNSYYLAFGPDQEHMCGFLGIPQQTTSSWLTLLLGDSGSEKDSTNELSQLEESLLLDLAIAVIKAIANTMKGSQNLQPAKTLAKAQLPVELQGIEEICKIDLIFKKADNESSSEAYFIVPCSLLSPIVGKKSRAGSNLSAADTSKAILAHLQQVPVSVTVRLTHTMVSFEEIMSLRPCDVLLLNKHIEEPIELIVEDQTIFRGRPAQYAGKKAVVITESLKHNTNNPKTHQIPQVKAQNVNEPAEALTTKKELEYVKSS
jgi:flagellar motor switch protein FliM